MYALAFACVILDGQSPSEYAFKVDEIRNHFCWCLIKENLLPFPATTKATRINVRTVSNLNSKNYCYSKLRLHFYSLFICFDIINFLGFFKDIFRNFILYLFFINHNFVFLCFQVFCLFFFLQILQYCNKASINPCSFQVLKSKTSSFQIKFDIYENKKKKTFVFILIVFFFIHIYSHRCV